MAKLKILCLSGDRRNEKEAQDQDVENSFTARHQTLSHLLHFTKSNPSLCHGNQSDQRPSGTLPPPSPSYEPCRRRRPFQCTLKWTPKGPRVHVVPKDCYHSLVWSPGSGHQLVPCRSNIHLPPNYVRSSNIYMEHFRSRNRVRGFGGIICGVERERGASPLRLAADE